MMRKLELKLMRAHDFVGDFAFYLRLGHSLRNAWILARDTIPSGRG